MNIELKLVKDEVRRRQRQALDANVSYMVLDRVKGIYVEKQPNGAADIVVGKCSDQ